MFAKWIQSLPRPAAAHQPVGERGALGDAHAALPAHDRVPLAGGPHRPRDGRRGREGDAADARVYRDFAEDWMAMPGHHGPQDRQPRSSPARCDTYCIEAHDAGQQGAAGRHLAQPRAELRQGLRRHVPERRPAGGNTSGTPSWGVSTRLIGAHRHDPLRRRGPGAAAAARAHAGRDRADLQGGGAGHGAGRDGPDREGPLQGRPA